MTPKISTCFAVLLALTSCEEKRTDPASGSGEEPVKRTTRADRPSRDIPSGRDKLRAAFETAKAREPGDDRNKAIAEVAWKTLESAPDLAAEFIRDLPAGTAEKAALVDAYLRQLFDEEKSDEALAWADSLGDGTDPASAKGRALVMLAGKHPEQAAKHLPVSDFTAAAVSPLTVEVLQTWVQQNPANAIAWTTRLPAGEARTAGYQAAFAQWFETDSKSAFSWVATQNNPHVRKEAVSAMVGLLISQPDPIRDFMLAPAAPDLRTEIEREIAEINRQTRAADFQQEQETPPEPVEPVQEDN